MSPAPESENQAPDPAAVFACAMSLWQACHNLAKTDRQFNLSEIFNGMDQFMREVMRIGTQFETWACQHVAFNELEDVWPYWLQDHFGEACLAKIFPSGLAKFDETDCLRIALHLRLPVRVGGDLPIPVDLTAPHPQAGAGFKAFRIQTVRGQDEDGDIVPFTADDEPYDEEFVGPPYFGLYGVGHDGLLEHIADRNTYPEVLTLAQKLAPGIAFPERPTYSPSRGGQ